MYHDLGFVLQKVFGLITTILNMEFSIFDIVLTGGDIILFSCLFGGILWCLKELLD